MNKCHQVWVSLSPTNVNCMWRYAEFFFFFCTLLIVLIVISLLHMLYENTCSKYYITYSWNCGEQLSIFLIETVPYGNCRFHVLYVWISWNGKCLPSRKWSWHMAVVVWQNCIEHCCSQFWTKWWICWNCCTLFCENSSSLYLHTSLNCSNNGSLLLLF